MKIATSSQHAPLSPVSDAILRHRMELLAFQTWQRPPRPAARGLERLARALLRAANEDLRRDT